MRQNTTRHVRKACFACSLFVALVFSLVWRRGGVCLCVFFVRCLARPKRLRHRFGTWHTRRSWQSPPVILPPAKLTEAKRVILPEPCRFTGGPAFLLCQQLSFTHLQLWSCTAKGPLSPRWRRPLWATTLAARSGGRGFVPLLALA